jgi:hypothetical protein
MRGGVSQDEDIEREKGGINATEHEFVKSRSALPVEAHDFAVKDRIQLPVYEKARFEKRAKVFPLREMNSGTPGRWRAEREAVVL